MFPGTLSLCTVLPTLSIAAEGRCSSFLAVNGNRTGDVIVRMVATILTATAEGIDSRAWPPAQNAEYEVSVPPVNKRKQLSTV